MSFHEWDWEVLIKVEIRKSKQDKLPNGIFDQARTKSIPCNQKMIPIAPMSDGMTTSNQVAKNSSSVESSSGRLVVPLKDHQTFLKEQKEASFTSELRMIIKETK
jgi:hypothetical protein